MASFLQRGNSWRAMIVRLGHRESATFPTRQDAEKWAALREAALLKPRAKSIFDGAIPKTRTAKTTKSKTAARPIGSTGIHLYVMQSSAGHIKIGRSQDPEERLKMLQTGSYGKITLRMVLHDCGHLEHAVHRALKDFHIGREWFHGSPECLKAFGRLIPLMLVHTSVKPAAIMQQAA